MRPTMGVTVIKASNIASQAVTKTAAFSDVKNITYTAPTDMASILIIVGVSNWCYQQVR